MSAKAPLVGWGPCPHADCSSHKGRQLIPYRRSSGGSLRWTCDHCLSTGYAEQNGPRERALVPTITAADNPAPAPAPTPAPKPATPRAVSTVFELGQL